MAATRVTENIISMDEIHANQLKYYKKVLSKSDVNISFSEKIDENGGTGSAGC